MSQNQQVSDAEIPTLREHRANEGLTLEACELLSEFGGDDGVDVSTLSRAERGLAHPGRKTIVKMARGYGVSVRRMTAMLEHTRQAAREARDALAK